ncbi:hypothetical protein [Myxococcus eversor]|uniref:hypothetical protein n=1 Tax=Myxococcus eversor TaxID=2709661 RepID=UPI0013CFCEB9|nr:hypothetical protein [Myxococcus eversor]
MQLRRQVGWALVASLVSACGPSARSAPETETEGVVASPLAELVVNGTFGGGTAAPDPWE